ncbi:amidohydrolase [Natronoglycomyces albus]|uniref:Amidohydrolase n=1 Tax=Natronoglycomyces albus TaxID=2811108 RepID=A0A895XGR2_9ACTN|nr:amidohydrolase [Natronoglycomyces albus]QSB05041.1 amidohydrolase [Natronoglycomyces albus]
MTKASFALTGATVLPITSEAIENGVVVVQDGKITAVGGADTAIPSGIETTDVSGKWVVPGLIDAHAHVGVSEEGMGWAGNDVNELTDPVTSHVRALDAINPAERGFRDAIEGGVLTLNINPGSGNVIGGETVAIKAHGRTVDEMALRSPSGVKSALGENPKRVYGDQKKTPSTRLGIAAVLRSAFVDAQNYMAKHAAATPEKPAERDLKMESLVKVLKGEIPWRQHCHRADDIATAMRVAEEFGYTLVLDHGTEAHLLADIVAEKNIPVIIGPLVTSRSKVELQNRSIANPGRLERAGVTIAITTDSPVVPIGHLITQVVLAVKEGLSRENALATVTINPARIMGVDDRVGSLEVGKDADLCVWSGDPLDIYSRVETAFIDGNDVTER